MSIFTHTPVSGLEDRIIHVRPTHGEYVPPYHGYFGAKNSGYIPLKIKEILEFSTTRKLSMSNLMLANPIHEFDAKETVFVIGLQNGIWEPDTSIYFFVLEGFESEFFIVRFNQPVDDLLLRLSS